jgi:hypothetical protein
MWQVAGWICALVAISCRPAPDIAAIQAVYEREASAGSALHDKDLQMLQAKCHEDGANGFLCEITFRATRRDGCISTSSRLPAPATAGSLRADCASADGKRQG